MKKKFSVQIIDALCKRCRICAEFCNRKVFSLTDNGKVRVEDANACTGCLLCELRCPDFAIDVDVMEMKE